MRITLIEGDITTVKCDALVNAANKSLLGGGGVDGAIHKAAGGELLEECRLLNGCETGEAKVTRAYNLSADYIIHTVGPVWKSGMHDEIELLSSCYKNILTAARDLKIGKLAIPGISTGIYHFPKELAASIAVKETQRFLERNPFPAEVLFVIYDKELLGYYKNLLQ